VDRRSLGARGARRRQARHQVDANGGLTTGQNALWWSALSEVFFLSTGVAWLAWLGCRPRSRP
jgi:hypothetical protein